MQVQTLPPALKITIFTTPKNGEHGSVNAVSEKIIDELFAALFTMTDLIQYLAYAELRAREGDIISQSTTLKQV